MTVDEAVAAAHQEWMTTHDHEPATIGEFIEYDRLMDAYGSEVDR